MKKYISTIVLFSVFMIGLSLLLYPSLSDFWNSIHQTYAIVDYDAALEKFTPEDYTSYFEAADAYNKSLKAMEEPLRNYDKAKGYEDVLNVRGNGIMGYIKIPRINVELPIYHGTSESVLAKAVGHLQGSSLPVGGKGTHCVLSAHRGLPSARLFTDLDQMQEGDTFSLNVLNRQLTYEVYQILVVEPDGISALAAEENADYCTLITCTPYGINSHRLLVQGKRIEESAEVQEVRKEREADSEARKLQMKRILVISAIIGTGLFFVIFWIVIMMFRRMRGKR